MKIIVIDMFEAKHEYIVNPNDTILSLKQKISQKDQSDVKEIRLNFGQDDLLDNKTVQSYNLKDGDTIYQSINLDF